MEQKLIDEKVREFSDEISPKLGVCMVCGMVIKETAVLCGNHWKEYENIKSSKQEWTLRKLAELELRIEELERGKKNDI